MGLIAAGEQGLIPVSQGLVERAPIPKDQMVAMTIWFDRRGYGQDDWGTPDDIAAFNMELLTRGQFVPYSEFEIPNVTVIDEGYSAFADVDRDIRYKLSGIRSNPLAVFIVTTPQVAERPWFAFMDPGIKKLRQQLGAYDTFVYKIILGAAIPFSKEGPKDPSGHFSGNSMRAYELGGVYLPYGYDYPSVSTGRLVEFMNRIMGCDLPGREFPDYSFEDLQKMAWHISREDFNLFSPREGALPKYSIVNGRPQFAC